MRATGELDDALELYQLAMNEVDNVDHPETRFRLHLRIGDIYHSKRKIEKAAKAYKIAVDGFGANELPVREGWAHPSRTGSSLAPKPSTAIL